MVHKFYGLLPAGVGKQDKSLTLFMPWAKVGLGGISLHRRYFIESPFDFFQEARSAVTGGALRCET